MRLIIAGSRYFTDYLFAAAKIDTLLSQTREPIVIVSGRCNTGNKTFTTASGIEVYGADGIGEWYANNKGLPVQPFPADWAKYGKMAGPFRNKQMAEYATHAIIFSDGNSKGSKSIILEATAAKLNFRIIKIDIPF